ncbi:helix-turn-helix domain containing protein [Serratia nevei]|uniref:helix-turn-helix domain-containing protein n=1 Tax=Serratia nevei TaxID=2703794 RepID=UPI0027D21102|nr:helix-turn-helix domain-containing protein [Serratia nevei]WMC77544.1 helix-turn-helix domain-containing protein [Serratia nevei]WMC83377.1 helix-turn-helix domain-containing protein [Serratia nevei]
MGLHKETNVAFQDNAKESIQDRLKKLMGPRSLRKAASDWGFPYSTLNNYFAKGTTPGVDVVVRVAEIEQVSVQWLILGTDDPSGGQIEQHEEQSHAGADEFQTLKVIWDNLEAKERSQLARLLGRKGADALTLLLDDDSLKLLMLSGEVRQAALMLEKLPVAKLEEILVECSKVQQDPTLNVQHKQAV